MDVALACMSWFRNRLGAGAVGSGHCRALTSHVIDRDPSSPGNARQAFMVENANTVTAKYRAGPRTRPRFQHHPELADRSDISDRSNPR